VLDPPADDQKRECDGEADTDNFPIPDAAGDSDACCQPGTGGASKPVNLGTMLSAHDNAGAQKADAGEDSLNHPAGGIRNLRDVAGRNGQHHDHGRGKADETKRLQA
jgi:hypothetical protein